MQDKSPSKPISFIRRHKVALVITLAIAATIALAYGIPPLVGDGTGKYSGTKRKVAEEALSGMYGAEDPMSRAVNRFNNFQYYVENVREMTPAEAKVCKYMNGDNTGLYLVEISKVTLFGIRGNNFVNLNNSCIASQKIKNTP